jgi:hypothetical protein
VHQIINIHSPIEDAAIDVDYLWTPNINIDFPTENAAIDRSKVMVCSLRPDNQLERCDSYKGWLWNSEGIVKE